MPAPSVPLAAIRQPAILYDAGGRIVAANDRAEALAGGPLAGMMPAEIVAAFSARGRDGTPLTPTELPAARALAGAEVVDAPLDVTAADGRTVQILATASPIRDGDTVTGALVVWQDATDAQHRASAEEGPELGTAFDTAPVGLCLFDRDLRFTRVNRRFAELNGISIEAHLGRTIREAMPSFADTLEAVACSVLETGTEVRDVPIQGRRPDEAGGPRHVITCWAPVRAPDGEITGISVAVVDVTSEARAQEAAREGDSKYRMLFDSIDQGFFVIDVLLDEHDRPVDLYYVEANDAATRMLGRDWTGKHLTELCPDHEAYWFEIFGTVARTGESVRLERYADPEKTWYDFYVFRIGGPESRRVGNTFLDITERKRAEEARREAEEHLRFALDAGRFGTFYYNPATGEIVRDAQAMAFWGLAPGEDLDLAGVAERIHPDDRERVLHLFWSAFDPDGDGTYEADYRILLPDGSIRWIRARGRVRFREADGTRTAVIMVGIEDDITGQKRVEAELIESAARLRASERDARTRAEEIAMIYDTAPVGLCVLDRDLRFVRLNHRFAEINGVPVEEHLGRTPGEVVPDLGEQAEAALRRVFETGETVELEVSVETPAGPGAVRYWDERWLPVRDEAGAIVGVSISAVEVTERKRAETALQESAAKYRDLFMNDITGDFVAGADGRILDCNPAFARLFGFASVDEALASSIIETYTSPADRDALLERIRTEGRIVNDERFRRRLDGTPIHVVENILGIFDQDGTLVRTQGYIIDDTQRYRAEAELRQYAEDLRRSNEDLERFAYVSSHDLQEPLRSIVSFSQLLERRYRGQLGQDGDEYIDFIVEGGNRMQTLILDLLAYSRVNTNPQELRPTDVGAVMAAVERHLEPQLREADATLTYDPLPTVTADPLQLEQVFANLVSNAVKFRRPEVPLRVHVAARRADDVWEFSVQDNGIGIEPEYFEKIFVIFQRLHTKEAYPGTGIGLAIVKRIVERHGGRVRVESAPGEGSTFVFTLPGA